MPNNSQKEPTIKNDTTSQVLIYLRKIMRAIDLHSKRLIQDYQVTGPQLMVLKEIDGSSEMSIGEIARQVNLSNATVTGIVDRLEIRGLVKRSRLESDRRKVIVKKTEQADSLLKSAPSPLQQQFISLFDNLDSNERDSILRSLQKVGSMMGAQDLDAAPVLSSFPPAASDIAVMNKIIHDLDTSSINKEGNKIESETGSAVEGARAHPEIHVIRDKREMPSWFTTDLLARFIHENIKPYEDTLPDTKRAVETAIDPDQPKGSFILLAESDGKPAGALIMHRTGMKGYVPENILLMVCVHPSMRGKGFGGLLIRRGIELADGDIKLHVEYDNPAKQVYEKIGFTSKYAEMRYLK